MGIFDLFRRKQRRLATPRPAGLLPDGSGSGGDNLLPPGYRQALASAIHDETRSNVRRRARDGADKSSYAKACINAVSKAAASVPWSLTVQAADETSSIVSSTMSPALRLLEQPNLYQGRAQFVRSALNSYQYHGRAVIVVWRDALGNPRDMVLAPVSIVSEVIDRQTGERGYEVKWPQGPRFYEARDVIDWFNPSVSNAAVPEGPWEICEDDRIGDAEAAEWQRESMGSRVLPDLAVSLGHNVSGQQVEDVIAGLRERSGSKGARKSLVVHGDMTVEQLTGSASAEVDFMESRKQFQIQMSAVFGVPRPVLGILENATLANLEASETMFWTGTVLPYLSSLADVLERWIRAEFGETFSLAPDTSAVAPLRAEASRLASAATAYHSIGVPFDDISKRLGLGFGTFDGSSTGFLPATATPTEMVTMGFGGGEGMGGSGSLSTLPFSDFNFPPAPGDDDER